MKRNFLPLLILTAALLAMAPLAQAQSRAKVPDHQLGGDAIGFRLEKTIKESVGDTELNNRSEVKIAQEDFMRIQQISALLLEVSKTEKPNFALVAQAAKEINRRAKRLKGRLALPKPPTNSEEDESAQAVSPALVTNQVAQLNASIRLFVTNPMFRNLKESDKDNSAEASAHLRDVIYISDELQKSADALDRGSRMK